MPSSSALTRPGFLVALISLSLILAAALIPNPGAAQERPSSPQERTDDAAKHVAQFKKTVAPILDRYCAKCHGERRQKGGIRFDEVDPDIVGGKDLETWTAVLHVLGNGNMPPQRSPQPEDAERKTLFDWLSQGVRKAEALHGSSTRSGLRRLNRAQYTHSLRELLGLSLDFGSRLPEDARSEMGFSNDGSVLMASALHLESYQTIARDALNQAIVDERPESSHYRVSFGKGRGKGKVGAKTGGYQSVPLSTDDFEVDVLDAAGKPAMGADEKEQSKLDATKRKITVGFRGSSQDRFHSTDEGLVLYSALPHKEVAPKSWQGPSPNVKLEMQRVFPQRGDFVLRVRASQGFLVNEKKALLVALEDTSSPLDIRDPNAEELRQRAHALEELGFSPWYQAGPFDAPAGKNPAQMKPLSKRSPLDFSAALADGSAWKVVDKIDDEILTYPRKSGVVLHGRHIDCASPRRLQLSLGSDDALRVWLNGKKVLDVNARRGVAKDQNFLAVDLKVGRNELLIETINHGGGFGSYQRLVDDGGRESFTPYEVVAGDESLVLSADQSRGRKNVKLDEGTLSAIDFPAEAEAKLDFESDGGYFRFDLVHPVHAPEAMGSIRIRLGELSLDMRPDFSAQDNEGPSLTAIGAGYIPPGRQTITLGGPFFVGFSHLVMSPLADDHPLVRRLEDQAKAMAAEETPALRAYIGTRTDDGMDYKTFDAPVEVKAARGNSQVYEFHGRLEDLPIPAPESGDDEILSGICVLGVWNDQLVKSNRETGPPLLIEALEFEAPYFASWPPRSHELIFGGFEDIADETARSRAILERFLARAFRRPATEAELERYLGFWGALRGEAASYETSISEVLVAVLCSPTFLFLIEAGDAVVDGQLSQYALASRLSYFLWNSPPDDELLRLAARGELHERLAKQVDRLLDDERCDRFVRVFVREWLRLDRLEGMTINPNRFPAFTRFVKRDMAEETYRFFAHALREDLDHFSLIDSDFAMLNQNLAEFYGVPGVEGIHFRPVALPRSAQRGGLLSQGAFLAGHSDGNEPHPIKRAVWVKEKILGQPPLPPPPNVPDLDPDAPDIDKLTLKERIELHRDNPSCRDCHASFDPYGIALETYNAVGIAETMRKGRPVDASSVLPDGSEVDGASGLKRYIIEKVPETFSNSLIKHLMAFGLGREVGIRDQESIDRIRNTVESEGRGMRSLIRAIVCSPSFSQP